MLKTAGGLVILSRRDIYLLFLFLNVAALRLLMVVIFTGVSSSGKSQQVPLGADMFIAHKLVCETTIYLILVFIVWRSVA